MQQRRFLTTSVLLFSILVSFAVNPTYQEYLRKVERINTRGGEPVALQSVSGHFNECRTETITLFPYAGERIEDEFCYNKWILVSMNGSIASRIIESYWPEIVFEGDLDGNGTDEFGVLLTGQHGATAVYKLLTVSDRILTDFLNIRVVTDGDEEIGSFVCQGNGKGEISLDYMEPSLEGPRSVKKTVIITKFLPR